MLIKHLRHLDYDCKVIFNCEEDKKHFLYSLLTDTACASWILCLYYLYRQPWVNIMDRQQSRMTGIQEDSEN